MCHLLCEYHQIKQAGVYLIFEQYCTPVSGLFMTPTRGIEAGFEHFPTHAVSAAIFVLGAKSKCVCDSKKGNEKQI